MQQSKQRLQGVGVGLRSAHYDEILASKPALDWFEALADNYMQPNCVEREVLLQVAEQYPVVLHSVGMSLGAQEPLNTDYFQRYKKLIEEVKPVLVSDHLCWISHGEQYLHELLPLPFTDEAVHHVAARIQQVQDWLGCQIAIENVSSYLQYQQNDMQEWEFLNAVAQEADCFVLFDINNLYVNAFNHGIDPMQYIDNIDGSRVKYFHLAGFEDCGTHLLDSHGTEVVPAVWQLYEQAQRVLGGEVPTLIEWDNNIPAFDVLLQHAQQARLIMEQAHA